MLKKGNEFEYKLITIYLLFIIYNFYVLVYKQYFECLLIYDFIGSVELLLSSIQCRWIIKVFIHIIVQCRVCSFLKVKINSIPIGNEGFSL